LTMLRPGRPKISPMKRTRMDERSAGVSPAV
jgi:hypothetical protein